LVAGSCNGSRERLVPVFDYFKAALANDLERAKQAEIQTVTTVTPGTGPS
jgi:hypothetical protein